MILYADASDSLVVIFVFRLQVDQMCFLTTCRRGFTFFRRRLLICTFCDERDANNISRRAVVCKSTSAEAISRWKLEPRARIYNYASRSSKNYILFRGIGWLEVCSGRIEQLWPEQTSQVLGQHSSISFFQSAFELSHQCSSSLHDPTFKYEKDAHLSWIQSSSSVQLAA